MLKLLCINKLSLCCFEVENYDINKIHCSTCKSTVAVQNTIAAITSTSVVIHWSFVMLNTPLSFSNSTYKSWLAFHFYNRLTVSIVNRITNCLFSFVWTFKKGWTSEKNVSIFAETIFTISKDIYREKYIAFITKLNATSCISLKI